MIGPQQPSAHTAQPCPRTDSLLVLASVVFTYLRSVRPFKHPALGPGLRYSPITASLLIPNNRTVTHPRVRHESSRKCHNYVSLLGTMATRNPLPQSDTILHSQDILRVENPSASAIFRTTPNKFVHSNQEFHHLLYFAKGPGSTGCGPGVIIFRWKFQLQRVGDFLDAKRGQSPVNVRRLNLG